MGFKIKNSLTGEFEKLPILTLKGEKGETGGVEEYNKVDYMGNKYETLKQANDANVEYAVKTAIGEFNYLDYEGQHITATDTIEGRAKSAILKGNTLVNVNRTSFIARNDITTDYSNSIPSFDCDLKPSTTYTIIGYSDNSYEYRLSEMRNQGVTEVGLGVFKVGVPYILNTDSRCSGLRGYLKGDTLNIPQGTEIKILIIEGDHSSENIPYFEGMQSVKMPVLKTTGKNLASPTLLELDSSGGNVTSTVISTNVKNQLASLMKIEPNKQIVISKKNKGKRFRCFFFDQEPIPNVTQSIGGMYSDITNVLTVTSPSNAKYLFVVWCNDKTTEYPEDFQVEYGTVATSHQPFKSNILTVNEEVELRKIGDVKDELNLLTGELTQRIEEVVLDGSELWTQGGSQSEGFVRFYAPPTNKKHATSKVMSSDITPYNGITPYGVVGYENITGYSHNIHLNVNIKKDRIGVTDLTNAKQNAELFKLWLSQNPITVQYELETPIIKTVDLSDNVVYSYDEVTHYDCSSESGSLVPTVAVKVPTDVQTTIAQQRETIQTLNSENKRLNQIQEALKASMLNSQVQLMNLSWDTDFEVFTLRESIAPKDFLLDSRTGSNIDKFSQAKFIIENDCPDLEKLNSQIEYYFSKDVFSQEQFEELTDLISIVKGENSCEY